MAKPTDEAAVASPDSAPDAANDTTAPGMGLRMTSNVMETVYARARAAHKTVVLPEADDVRTVAAASGS